MSRYAVLVAAAFVLRGATGSAAAVGYGGGGVLLAGLILEGGYRISATGGVRPIPRNRAPLDRLVRWQWLGAGLAGVATAMAWGDFDLGGLGLGGGNLGLFLNAVVTAATIAIVAIFVSSLIDWYWILPRISGIVRKAPCEEGGGQRWSRVTGVWLFHRGVATTIVAGCLSGVFIYMGEHDTSRSGNWYIVALVVGAATFAFLNAASRALWLALNPRVRVGDALDVHGRRCHVVDISIQGAKYVALDDDPQDFREKEDGSISLEDFGRFARDASATPPCANGCKKLNWYCHRNPHAYD